MRPGAPLRRSREDLREKRRSKRVEFYTHEEGWKNKLICGDSLHVMESLLHYENLRGKVQMIYIDPPYGIKYDSNFQQRVDSTKNDEKDEADDVLTIKAFRDTWSLGVHSYLSYLQERCICAASCLRTPAASSFRSATKTCTGTRPHGRGVRRGKLLLADRFRKTSCPEPPHFSATTLDFLVWYANGQAETEVSTTLSAEIAGRADEARNTVPGRTPGRHRSRPMTRRSSMPRIAQFAERQPCRYGPLTSAR